MTSDLVALHLTSRTCQVTPTTVKKAPAGKDIWDAEFVPEGVSTDHEETRPQPQYDMCFKQNVGTEDMFLGVYSSRTFFLILGDFLGDNCVPKN